MTNNSRGGNEHGGVPRAQYDFEEVKRTAARMVELTIEEGLKGEISVDEWNQVADLLKRCGSNVVVHALIAAITYKMAMKQVGRADPPFHYQERSERGKFGW